MSRQQLGARWIRRIEHAIDTSVIHASGNGTYWHDFTTYDHRHGQIHARTLAVEWLAACPGFTSCKSLFDVDMEIRFKEHYLGRSTG